MKNSVENLEVSAYQMSDKELGDILDAIFLPRAENMNLKKLSSKELDEIMEFSQTIPLTTTVINALVWLGHDKEELEEENRRLYAERGWEKYL